MISQSHYRSQSFGLAGWWVAVVLGVLGSFTAQVLVRAGHVHDTPGRADEVHGSHPASGCGHRHHHGVHNPSERPHSDEDSPCEVCLKLTLAAFTSIVGGPSGALVLPVAVVAGVDVDAAWSVRAVSVWRATSRGPPTVA